MNENEIKEKLKENGFENYIPLFEENHLLDEAVLSSMTNEDYISIGIKIIGDRKKLLLLFQNNYNPNKAAEEKTKETAAAETKSDEYINTYKNGKQYCYKSSEPDKLLCRKCHAVVSEESTLCWNCNNNLVEQKTAPSSSSYNNNYNTNNSSGNAEYEKSESQVSSKSRIAALLLCFFLGALSIHRFYVGKTGSGILQIILNCCFGIGFIWVLIDFILIVVGKFEDSEGKLLENWS